MKHLLSFSERNGGLINGQWERSNAIGHGAMENWSLCNGAMGNWSMCNGAMGKWVIGNWTWCNRVRGKLAVYPIQGLYRHSQANTVYYTPMQTF